MMRRILAAIVFTATVTGCALPPATVALLDVAADGLDKAVANQQAAQATILAGLDAQGTAALAAAQSDLKANAADDKVALADALALLEAYHDQAEALALVRRRAELDGQRAMDNLDAVRQTVDQTRRLILYSQSMSASLRQYLDQAIGKEPSRDQAQ